MFTESWCACKLLLSSYLISAYLICMSSLSYLYLCANRGVFVQLTCIGLGLLHASSMTNIIPSSQRFLDTVAGYEIGYQKRGSFNYWYLVWATLVCRDDGCTKVV